MAFRLKIILQPVQMHLPLSLVFLLLLPLPVGLGGETARSFPRSQIDFFERSVRPLLVEHCAECHSQESKPLRGHFRVDDRRLLLGGGDRGPAIVPGSPEDSLLWRAVEYEDEDLQMPPAGQLSEREREVIKQWIRLGLPMPDTKNRDSSPGKNLSEDGAQHWSFVPLGNNSLPGIRQQDWARTRVDVFVSRGHHREKLRPSPPATRRELIRRLNFDLLGLPPSSDALNAFQADRSVDAWERLVDRTLASPRYGERWGRYWLDLARYTDTTASWLQSTGQAHLYRDWVIGALNRDLAYDRFVTLQLAADKMPVSDSRDIAALGFLGLSPTYWKELQLSKEVIREIVAEEWEERIDVVGRTFLGLSIACARCHDHKFDPITTRDYYALAGVFASTRLVGRSLLPPDEARVVEKAHHRVHEIEKQIARLKQEKKEADSQETIAALQEEVKNLKEDTPHFEQPLAHAVDDASLYVLDDGPDRTRLEYREGQPRDLPVFLRGNPATPGD
ncbi:MAG: DUF1549 domain-containing protein, partial [Pirellulaceae bacterium]|nr:DUF1549 domain-containing protein [Pirellulaceae bacterium]